MAPNATAVFNKSRIEIPPPRMTPECAAAAAKISPIFQETAATAAVTVSGIWTVLYTWSGLLFAGTFFKTKYFSAFNVIQNYKELTHAKISKLTCIDYFRVIAILWVMVNHTGSEGRIDILERAPSAKAFKDAVHNHPLFGPLFGNSALGVEIFLVLSGLLAARSWSRVQTRDGFCPREYLGFLAKRALRLFPSVAVFIYLASSSLTLEYLPRFHDTMLSTCGWRGLAAHLTFTGNWQSTPTCLGYLWYLGLDFQLYALSPLLMAVLMWKAWAGVALVSGLVFASAVYRGVLCQWYDVCNQSDVDIPFISYPNQTEQELQRIYRGLWLIYSRPCTKCGPFFIGLLAGWLSTRLTHAPALPRRLLSFLNTLAIAGAVFCVFGILPEYWHPEAGNTAYNTFYTASFRSIFAACIAWLIVYGIYWYKAQFSLLFNVLATLTFQAYLLHMPVVYLFNHVPFLQTAQGPWEVLAVLPGVAALSYAGAFIMYLFVEAPMAKVAGYFYDQVKQSLMQPASSVAALSCSRSLTEAKKLV